MQALGASGRPLVGLLLLAAWSAAPAASVPTVTLAVDSVAQVDIVLPAVATPQERTAAAELAHYLFEATGGTFSIRPETATVDARAGAIRVGDTRRAIEADLAAGDFDPEGWAIRADGTDLVLNGGRPRGVLYAVYRFLEDHVGVRWWSPYAETIPWQPTLAVGAVERRGSPAFAYRDIHGLTGEVEFAARNRINGHFSRLPWAFGGRIEYGPPRHVHNFYQYTPPEDLFDSHPEYYSELFGLRVGSRAQLCMTNAGLRRHLERRLRGYIETARAAPRPDGAPPPALFAISQNDWGRPCECAECARVLAREGSHAGALIEALNEVAESIATAYPEVRIDTLAYHYTFDPPASIRVRDNIVIRLSGLQRRDFLRPVTDPANASILGAVLAWRARAANLRVWDYPVTYGEQGELPLPNTRNLAADLRFYGEAGVEGLFLEHSHPVDADLRDLKLWLAAKLLEDPSRDYDTLLREFTDGFYGRAGRFVRRYVAVLERSAARQSTRLRWDSGPEAFEFLDRRTLRRCDRLLRRAAAAASSEPFRRHRVAHARLTLDRAILLLLPRISRGRAGRAGWHESGEAIARRYLDTWRREAGIRLPAAAAARAVEAAAAEVDRLLPIWHESGLP